MAIDSRRILQWLDGRSFPSKRVVYTVERVTQDFVLFAATPSTGRVMIPLEVVIEWITAYSLGKLKAHQSPREMRTTAQKGSGWAKQLHSFETHLAAVIQQWAIDGF
jgi:hypothetical protein